jgi:hypothetical protein
MDLTLREGYLLKFCMKLTTVISHDNYYSQFDPTPSTNQAILPYFKYNLILSDIFRLLLQSVHDPKTMFKASYLTKSKRYCSYLA